VGRPRCQSCNLQLTATKLQYGMCDFAQGSLPCHFAGQLGLQMESPLVRGGSLVLLLTWLAFWFVVARQLGTEGQLKGDTEIY
jgi:hypothetical protein